MIVRSTKLVGAERVIAFRPEISRELGSIPATILFQQLQFWADKGDRPDGWFWKSATEIEDETTLTPQQTRTAITKLQKLGWIESKVMRAMGAPTRHFRLLKTVVTTILPVDKPVDNSIPIVTKEQFGKLKKNNSESDEITNLEHKMTHKITHKKKGDGLTPYKSLEELRANKQRLANMKATHGLG